MKGLQAESCVLKQSLEECNIASISVGLSSSGQDQLVQMLLKEASIKVEENDINKVAMGKRKHFVLDLSEKQVETSQANIDGCMTLSLYGRTHINWKTGVYACLISPFL